MLRLLLFAIGPATLAQNGSSTCTTSRLPWISGMIAIERKLPRHDLG